MQGTTDGEHNNFTTSVESQKGSNCLSHGLKSTYNDTILLPENLEESKVIFNSQDVKGKIGFIQDFYIQMHLQQLSYLHSDNHSRICSHNNLKLSSYNTFLHSRHLLLNGIRLINHSHLLFCIQKLELFCYRISNQTSFFLHTRINNVQAFETLS